MDETKGSISVPLSSGGAINIFPHRPLKIKPSTPGKLNYDEGKRIPRKKGQPAGSKKHSDLYTDENPKGTIQGLKFATVKDAEASVSKIKNSGKKHAHKIQAAIAMEQRAKAAGKQSAAAVYRRYINAMKKKTKKMNEAVSQIDIDQLEVFADKLFAKVGIDVEFTRHFLDRVNDARNVKPITMAELTRLFKQEYKRYGKPIAQMGPGKEAVMKDLQTDINLPFALQYDRENNELDLIAKTVMRKKDFRTSNKEFAVEGYQLKLENDKDQLILHIKDTKTGERSEVRGKSNYEIDYDASDPLHKLLDQIGKSANISQLMNGETVSINPKHPSGPQSIDTVKRIMDENEDIGSLINFGGKTPGTKGFSQQKSDRGYKWIPGSNGVKTQHSNTNYKLRPGQKKPNMLQRAWSSLVDDIELDEGVNDPHIFKAVFLAGGPGSGKSFVAKNILGGTGLLKTMNSDDVYEILDEEAGSCSGS